MTKLTLLECADRYIEQNRRLIITNRYKKPLLANWQETATNDPEQIREWLKQYPKANIAIVTGKPSNLFVVDIDVKHGVDGIKSIENHFGSIQLDDEGLIACSPSGGYHLYFQYEPTWSMKNAVGLLEGVDIRGDGGFIIAPPSYGIYNGQWWQYEWLNSEAPLLPAPDWVRELVQLTPTHSTNPDSSVSGFDPKTAMQGIAEGKRNYELYRYLCHLRAKNLPKDLVDAFMSTAASRCVPPLPEEEMQNIVARAYSSLPKNLTRGLKK